MKTRLSILIAMVLLTSCKTGGATEQPKPYEPQTYNEKLIWALADGYTTFIETDTLPASITTLDGDILTEASWFEAGCRLVIADHNGTMDSDIVLWPTSKVATDPANKESLEQDVADMALLYDCCQRQIDYAGLLSSKTFANYTKYPNSKVDNYTGLLSFNRIGAMLLRVCAYYREHLAFPESFSSWPSDYLHSTKNCPIDDPVVVAALAKCTEGCTTDMEKAMAIFAYVRDDMEWINYANTRYGAVSTISNLEGNCCDLSHANIALARAAGIPARYVHAVCHYVASGSDIGHVFAQVYVDGTWYICDASNNINTFGNHEAWSEMVPLHARLTELYF